MSDHIKNIGGVFIYSRKADKLAKWYTDNLGINFEIFGEEVKHHYTSYFYHEIESGLKRYLVFSVIQNNDRPEFDGKAFTVNYRVDDVEYLCKELVSKEIAVKGPEEYPEGKFAWTEDPDGNIIELWEDTSS